MGGGCFFGNRYDQLVILIRADEQGRGKRFKAPLGGTACRFFQTLSIASDAPIVKIVAHRLQKRTQTVFVVDDQRQVDRFCVFFQRGFTASIFGVRMNVRIIPISCWLDTFVPQGFNTPNGARGTADVQ